MESKGSSLVLFWLTSVMVPHVIAYDVTVMWAGLYTKFKIINIKLSYLSVSAGYKTPRQTSINSNKVKKPAPVNSPK